MMFKKKKAKQKINTKRPNFQPTALTRHLYRSLGLQVSAKPLVYYILPKITLSEYVLDSFKLGK